jgi:hypothetical protein
MEEEMSEYTEADLLAQARESTDAKLDAVFEKAVQRRKNAVLSAKQAVLHERALADMRLRRMKHVEEMSEMKDRAIASLQSALDGWVEFARRHGLTEDEAPKRSH